jgi:hypothetical protein
MISGQSKAFGRQHGRRMPRRSTRKLTLDGGHDHPFQRTRSTKEFAEDAPVTVACILLSGFGWID